MLMKYKELHETVRFKFYILRTDIDRRLDTEKFWTSDLKTNFDIYQTSPWREILHDSLASGGVLLQKSFDRGGELILSNNIPWDVWN